MTNQIAYAERVAEGRRLAATAQLFAGHFQHYLQMNSAEFAQLDRAPWRAVAIS